MKFLFFKSSRPEPKQPDAFKAAAPRLTIPVAPPPPPPVSATTEARVTIPFRVESLLPQLPAPLAVCVPQLRGATIAIPVELLLPKLGTGRITLTLKELVPLLPAERLPQPLPPLPEQSVVLPLQQVIAAIPPHLLNIQHESVIDLDNLDQDGSLFAEPVVQPVAIATTAPPPAPAAPVSPSKSINISLRTLITAMPEHVLAAPRAELWRRVRADATVPLPLDLILPQLQAARVSLPLRLLISVVPTSVLVDPLPTVDGETVSIPLPELVMQLPPELFVARLGTPVEMDVDEIPTPFAEKGTAPQTTPVAPAEPPVVVEPVPVCEVSPEKLADENFAIFSEKKAPVAEPVADAPTRVAVPPAPVIMPVEPVAEVVPPPPPAVEPVAAVMPPVEPVSAPPVPTDPDGAKFLINLNQCIIDDLLTIEGIGPALARRIIEFRDTRGGLKSIEELHEIPGIGRKTFRALAGVKPRALNRLLGVPEEQELTLQEIVRLTSALPGIQGSLLAMADGVFLTGQLPVQFNQTTISAFAPQLFKKVGRYTRELQVGEVRRMTVFTDQQPVSIFEAGEVYLIVIHDPRRFSKALLRRCERISQEIARLCRQRAVVQGV